jgi:hypothetical protein
MKRSIDGRELRFRETRLSFRLISDPVTNVTGVEIREGPTKTYGRPQQKLVIWRHQLPSVISHLRWALSDLPRRANARPRQDEKRRG